MHSEKAEHFDFIRAFTEHVVYTLECTNLVVISRFTRKVRVAL